MHVTVSQAELASALKSIQPAISSTATPPVLLNILLKTDGEQIRLMATDLELFLTASCSARVTMPGAVLLPARRFVSLIGSLTPGDVSIEVEETKKRATIRGGDYVWRTPLEPVEDFPTAPTQMEYTLAFTMRPAALKPLLTAVARVVLPHGKVGTAGLCLRSYETQVHAVATDGNRMAILRFDAHTAEPIDLLITSRGAHALAALSQDDEDDVQIADGEAHVRFTCGTREVYARKVHERFVDYQRVIPKQVQAELTANRVALLSALERAAVLSQKEITKTVLDVQAGYVDVAFTNASAGDSRERVPVTYAGEPFQIVAQVGYLIDALTPLASPDVRVRFAGERTPFTVTPITPDHGDFMTVISQMR